MELSDLEKIRLEKIHALRSMGIEPFPTRANPTHSAREAIAAFEAAETESGGGWPRAGASNRASGFGNRASGAECNKKKIENGCLDPFSHSQS